MTDKINIDPEAMAKLSSAIGEMVKRVFPDGLPKVPSFGPLAVPELVDPADYMVNIDVPLDMPVVATIYLHPANDDD